MKQEKETRNLQLECRTSEDSRKIEGVAIVFNVLSENMGGFREVILPEAIEGVIEESDIFFLYNHNAERGFLARSRNGIGSLKTNVMSDGVHFSFDAPHTALGDEVLEHMHRGDINQCSFAFTIKEDSWEKQVDGSYIRTIKKFERLYDMSLVDTPAYPQTTACARFNEIKEEERKQLEEAIRIEEEKRAAELKSYYDKIREDNNKYLKIE